jgi:hypothetical protein
MLNGMTRDRSRSETNQCGHGGWQRCGDGFPTSTHPTRFVSTLAVEPLEREAPLQRLDLFNLPTRGTNYMSNSRFFYAVSCFVIPICAIAYAVYLMRLDANSPCIVSPSSVLLSLVLSQLIAWLVYFFRLRKNHIFFKRIVISTLVITLLISILLGVMSVYAWNNPTLSLSLPAC